MQPSRFSSVDLPLPEEPMIAQYSPARKLWLMPSSARTSVAPMR
jgi:hypothetical protein